MVRLAVALLAAALPLACSSSDSKKPGSPDPPLDPALFFSPGITCVKAASGIDSLLVLNQGKGELDWNPVSVPNWVEGLDAEVRLGAGEARMIRWSWASRPEAPFSDTVVVATNDPNHGTVRLVFEERSAVPPVTPPPTPLIAFPADSARFSVGDTILVAWQDFQACSPIEYRLQISLNAAFTKVVCCQEFVRLPGLEVIVDQGDEGPAWWRIVPRWVGGSTGLPSPARMWVVD